MRDDFENVYDMIEHAIDYAFTKGNMQLKFYEFLKYRKTTKQEVDAFIESSTFLFSLSNPTIIASTLSPLANLEGRAFSTSFANWLFLIKIDGPLFPALT